MKNVCCVCGNEAEGLITFGGFVCYTCHEEATGERVKPIEYSDRVRTVPPKRHRLRDALIAERNNNLKERSL
jgi:hypothetical protein